MRQNKRSLLLVVCLLALAGSSLGQRSGLVIDYTVQISNPSTQEAHITTKFSNINQPTLTLSLPTWTPGWYTVENYYKNVLRFRITDSAGKVLPHTMSKKQTWIIDTKGI